MAPEFTADVSVLGNDLPVNVREALRYRIRKKRALSSLIASLGDAYSALQDAADGGGNGSTAPLGGAADSGVGGGGTGGGDELLPAIAGMDRIERRARIRELMDEVSVVISLRTCFLRRHV